MRFDVCLRGHVVGETTSSGKSLAYLVATSPIIAGYRSSSTGFSSFYSKFLLDTNLNNVRLVWRQTLESPWYERRRL